MLQPDMKLIKKRQADRKLLASCSFHLIIKLEKQQYLQTDWNLLAAIYRVETGIEEQKSKRK